MRKTHGHRRDFYRYAVIILALVFLVSFILLLVQLWENKHDRFSEVNNDNESIVEFEGKEYVLRDDIETFLVMGLDKFEGDVVSDSYNNDQQADFLMLFVYDKAAQTYTAIHINRDTMTDVNVLGVAGERVDTLNKQVALAHTYGNGREVSCRNTVDAVSQILSGMKIDHYISLTMTSVPIYNDLLGGVSVLIVDDFTGIDDTLKQGETVTLMGEQALNYVRTRYGLEDSSNSARMERQRQYMEALYKKTVKRIEEDEEFIIEASLKMADHIVSDRSVTQIQNLVKQSVEYEFMGITYLEGENKVGEEFMEFYPDEDFVKETVIKLFYELKD